MYEELYISEKIFRKKITIINFLCIVIVIFIHTYNIDVYNLEGKEFNLEASIYWLERYFKVLTAIGTPFFFIISGYLFFRTFSFSRECITSKYLSRLKTIVIPYLIWNTIYYLYFVLLTNVPSIASHMNSEKIEFSLRVWLEWMWLDKYYIFWFLQDLMVMILISPLLYLVLKDYKRFRNLVGNGFIAMIIMYIITSGLVCKHVPYFSFFYVVGAYIGINYKDVPKFFNRRYRLICILGVVAMLLISVIRLCANVSLSRVEVIFFCICIWGAIEVKESLKDKKLPMLIGESFFIYCSHDMVLEAVEKIWLMIGGESPLAAVIDYFCAPIISLFIIWILLKLLGLIPTVGNLLTGGRLGCVEGNR